MSNQAHGAEIRKLAKSIYELYEGLGEPDVISFLDRGVRFSWSATQARLDRYEEIPVDTKFLHYSSGATWSCCEIYVYLYGNEAPVQSSWREIWARIDDMASSG